MAEDNGTAALMEYVKQVERRAYLRRADFKTDAEWQQYKAQKDQKRRKKIETTGEVTAGDSGVGLIVQATTIRKTDLSRLKGRERFCTSPQGGPIYVRQSYCKILNLITGELEDKSRGDVWVVSLLPATASEK